MQLIGKIFKAISSRKRNILKQDYSVSRSSAHIGLNTWYSAQQLNSYDNVDWNQFKEGLLLAFGEKLDALMDEVDRPDYNTQRVMWHLLGLKEYRNLLLRMNNPEIEIERLRSELEGIDAGEE